MDFDSLIWLKDFNFVKYFDITTHTIILDDSKWKTDELLTDINFGFRKIKWTTCENDAIYINFEDKICYWETHSSVVDSLDERIVHIDKIMNEFIDKLKKMERYLIYLQERDQLLWSNKFFVQMGNKNQKDFKEQVDILERKIVSFKNIIQTLRKNRKLELFFDIKSSFEQIKETVFDIYKIVYTLLNELSVESLLKAINDSLTLNLANKHSEEETKGDENSSQSLIGMYHRSLDILITNYISSVKVKTFEESIHELYKFSENADNKIEEWKTVRFFVSWLILSLI